MSAPSPATTSPGQPLAAASAASGIEVHSVDWVPLDERHGKPSHLGALWFVGNINLTAMATGVTALSIGAGLLWTVIATVLGSLFGTFFMAFHSAQGPQLGLPQLVQSRPQFGYLGAAVTVWVFALINYVAYNTSDAILSGDAMHTLFGLTPNAGYFVAAAVAALIALFGYHWIHRVSRWLTWPLIAVMVVLTVAALADSGLPGNAFALGSFHVGAFMTVFVIVAGFQLGWAPYVSDYSRYLPRNVSASRTYWAVFGGNALGACLYGGLGIYITALSPDSDSVVSLGTIAGKWILPIMALSLLGSDAMNAYTGMLSLESVRSTFQKVVASRAARVTGLLVMFVAATILAETGYKTFLTSFENFINVLLFFFVPWSVINLVDFYLVKKGRYDVASFFTPKGIYGGWRWTALIPYVIALGAQVPFIDQTLYVGPMVKVIGGADISWLVGFIVAGVGYLIAVRITGGRAQVAAAETQGAVSS